MQNSMMLISSTWAEQPTFKLLPISKDCPYNEVIFDPQSRALAIVGKEKKQTLHMLPKLTDTGDVQMIKVTKRDNGKQYAETRVSMETFYEYFIEKKEEVENFINTFAANSDTYDWQSQVTAAYTAPVAPKGPMIVSAPSIITE